MTTINTSEDLLRLLREDPHFYEQARRLILTDELIALPERFAAFALRVDGFIAKQEQFNERTDGFTAKQEQFNERVDGFIAKQEQFNERVDGFIAKQEQFNERVDGFIAKQEQFNERTDARFERIDARFERVDARFERVDARFDRIDARFDRIEGDLSHFKNRFSESQVAEEAATIAMAMGFTLARVLSNADLVQMCLHPDAGLLPHGDLVSFTRADLVLEVSNEEGNRQFVAVEISYTADRRDTDRARRNADYITLFTGQPAHAAVASARNDHDIQSLIDEGAIRWYALEDHADEAEVR